MCKACDKLFGNWYQLKSTTEYLQALASVIGIPITELVQIIQGGIPEKQVTLFNCPLTCIQLLILRWKNLYSNLQRLSLCCLINKVAFLWGSDVDVNNRQYC